MEYYIERDTPKKVVLYGTKYVRNTTLIATLVLVALAIGAFAYIANQTLLITLQQHIQTTDMPATLTASPGDNFTWSWNIFNRGQHPNNFTVTVSTNASANQVKINIRNDAGALLASSTSGSVSTGDLLVNESSWLYSTNGTIELQFNLSAPAGVYEVNLTTNPGTFNWRI